MIACCDCEYLKGCKEDIYSVCPCACITKIYPAWIDPNGEYTEYQYPTDGKFYKTPYKDDTAK